MSSLSKELRDGLKKDPVTMTFGPEGFFGYAPCTNSALEPSTQDDEENIFMWWSTYEAESPPSRSMPLTDVHTQLIKRHGFWKLPYDTPTNAVYSSIINLACGINTDENTTHTPTAAERNFPDTSRLVFLTGAPLPAKSFFSVMRLTQCPPIPVRVFPALLRMV
jgi:hypothetical protein